MENDLTAYCVKCRANRPIRDAQPVFMTNGRPATRGVCPECGAGLFKIGATPAHAALAKGEVSAGVDAAQKAAGKTRSAASAEEGLPAGAAQSRAGEETLRKTAQAAKPAARAAKPRAAGGSKAAAPAGGGEASPAAGGQAADRIGTPLTEPVEAYCIVCKERRVMKGGQAVYLANGSPAAEGSCPKCGTRLYKLGFTKDHEKLPRPVVSQAPRPARDTFQAGSPARGRGQGTGTNQGRPGAGPGPRGQAARTQAGRPRSAAAPATERRPRPGTGRSGHKLVIVESPAKARTVGRFLGQGYEVRASVGHVRDLLRSKLSVDLEHDFAPTYRVPNEKRDIVKELRDAAQRAGEVYLATDPDREGEAIAWHLLEAAEIPADRTHRVVFHEITRNAINEAFAHSRDIDMHLVDAQQARRILDRLVGYQVSPLLWSRVRSHLSAGRVQTVALRLIVEREHEIAAFVPVEYWSIDADLAQLKTRELDPRPGFRARLVRIEGAEPDLKNRADAERIVAELERAAYAVSSIKRGERRRRPNPPFTTSTLQQDAAQRLGMTAQRTMRIAQELYEGIEIGAEGTVGLITYMRTDSVNVAQEAQAEARALIAEQYGPEYLPPEPNIYKSRAKNAQEAHEAIRPTSSRRTPQAVRQALNRDQFRLYELIWQRFIASQMAPAIYDTLTVEVAAGRESVEARQRPYLFRTSGSKVRFPGFLVVYTGGASGPASNGADGDAAAENGAGGSAGNGYSEEGAEGAAGQAGASGQPAGQEVPADLAEDELLDLLRLLPEQHFTQPPPRYSEATLVKALEENGIGRPSTYATIISTILDRGYVERADKKLAPTELGFTVNDLLVKYFDELFKVGFTASMEEHLDSIASGDEKLVPVLRDFYDFFQPQLQVAESSMEKVRVEPEKLGEPCPECGGELVIKMGRFGKFIACANYPNCRYTRPLVTRIGVACPRDGGELVERRTKRGRVFYGCANYPQCDFTSWKRPLPQPCPRCGRLLVAANRDWAECTACQQRVRLDKLETGEKALAEAGDKR